MAHIHQGLFVVLSVVAVALSQQNDPVKDFCRRWGHTTAQIDSRLYIDGGMVGSTPFDANRTNPWLLYSDLNTSTIEAGMPSQYANLSKPGNIPSVSGAYTWSDNTNKCFYQFGGEYPAGVSPTEFGMWTYDVPLNQWNSTPTTGDKDIQRVSFGAGTQIESRGLGFYFGGWLSNKTMLSWKGPPMATSGLIQFDMSSGALTNTSGPDDIGRAEGELVFLPVSDSGVLIYFGGIEDSYRNGSFDAANMSTIHIYDMASSKWYTQTATGDAPPSRRQFCADVTWPDDQSSFNIYLYGGYGFGDRPAYDDVYILSLPSFTWIKVFPVDGSDSKPSTVGHGGCSANVINRAQMLVIGGWFPLFNKCDTPEGQGQHNMVLGYNGGDSKLWDKFDPKLDDYVVPSPIIAAVGGGPTGGATKTAPATWGHPDLATYYTLKPTFPARSPTRSIPSPTGLPSGVSKPKNIAAIAGGVVGGLVALAAILCLLLFCLHRRKKAGNEADVVAPPPPPPAELGTTPIPHEMSGAEDAASKYVHVHEQADRIALHNYPGPHSHSPSQQGPPSYGHTPPYTSPTEGLHPHHQEMFFPTNGAVRNSPPATWDQYPQAAQGDHYPQSAQGDQYQHSATAQTQYAYPTPTSPLQSSNDHYPPNSHAGSPTGTQYSGEAHPGISTTNTPAHFYAQPASRTSPGREDVLGHGR